MLKQKSISHNKKESLTINDVPHIVIDALNLSHGGGVIVMERLAKEFKIAGYRVTVLTARRLPNVNLGCLGIDVVLIEKAKGVLRSGLFRLLHFDKRMKTIGADVVLGFNYYTPTKLPQVTYHINVIPFLKLRDRISAVGLVRAFLQRQSSISALRSSTMNIFESNYVLALAQHQCKQIKKPSVSYIGTELPGDLSDVANAPSQRPLVSVSSGAKHKRNDLTIEFFRLLLSKDPTARLTLVGDRSSIYESLSVEDRRFVDTTHSITFTGYIGREELYDLLSSARALVTFSELESFFMVGIEAMSVGCPVIGANNSSIEESLGSAGLLVAAGELDKAVEMALMVEQPEFRDELEHSCRSWAGRFDATTCASDFVKSVEHGILTLIKPMNQEENSQWGS